ncbi:hypothetical protein ACPPVQ_05960 [Diaminobutyricibacter sp. McL0618]|uniref:hypothetical protein n=1 Tax=Leifsonia sp. McL0618 TaxID=3415677 RepID=UPI003CEC2EE6
MAQVKRIVVQLPDGTALPPRDSPTGRRKPTVNPAHAFVLRTREERGHARESVQGRMVGWEITAPGAPGNTDPTVLMGPGSTKVSARGVEVELDPALVYQALVMVAGLTDRKRALFASLPPADAARLLSAALPTANVADEKVGPFYDTRGLVDRWRISPAAVHKRADTGQLLKVITAEGAALYPAWQFDSTGGLLPHLAEVREALAPAITDPWTIGAWLNSPRRLLDGRTPADALRQGRVDEVLAAAAALSDRLSA